ncbi:MAG: hypothetical protein SH850_07985 [Planctomycetaceae bacterium]|nr:hypothetical protein [Planctomycetaceae bacterium]
MILDAIVIPDKQQAERLTHAQRVAMRRRVIELRRQHGLDAAGDPIDGPVRLGDILPVVVARIIQQPDAC